MILHRSLETSLFVGLFLPKSQRRVREEFVELARSFWGASVVRVVGQVAFIGKMFGIMHR